MKVLLAVFTLFLAETAMAEVPFLTGGIGKTEREVVLAQKSNYNFEIRAALKTGHYVSSVHYSITDSSGTELLSAEAEGPYFFATLPVGNYKVTAKYGEQTLTKSVSIAKNTSMREAIFRFNGNEEVVGDE